MYSGNCNFVNYCLFITQEYLLVHVETLSQNANIQLISVEVDMMLVMSATCRFLRTQVLTRSTQSQSLNNTKVSIQYIHPKDTRALTLTGNTDK